MSITGTSHNDSGLFFIQFKSTDISYSILRQSSLLAQVLFVNITSSHHQFSSPLSLSSWSWSRSTPRATNKCVSSITGTSHNDSGLFLIQSKGLVLSWLISSPSLSSSGSWSSSPWAAWSSPSPSSSWPWSTSAPVAIKCVSSADKGRLVTLWQSWTQH